MAGKIPEIEKSKIVKNIYNYLEQPNLAVRTRILYEQDKNSFEIFKKLEPKTEYEKLSFYETFRMLIEMSPKIFKVLYYLIIMLRKIDMKDFKTTITSIIGSLLLILGIFGVNLAPESKDLIITIIVSVYALINLLKGYFTKDK